MTWLLAIGAFFLLRNKPADSNAEQPKNTGIVPPTGPFTKMPVRADPPLAEYGMKTENPTVNQGSPTVNAEGKLTGSFGNFGGFGSFQ